MGYIISCAKRPACFSILQLSHPARAGQIAAPVISVERQLCVARVASVHPGRSGLPRGVLLLLRQRLPHHQLRRRARLLRQGAGVQHHAEQAQDGLRLARPRGALHRRKDTVGGTYEIA